MTPSEKYGADFIFDRLSIPQSDGSRLSAHQACVCIAPKEDEASTLEYAWQIVRELAKWLTETFVGLPEGERFQVIVGWSQAVRRHQGQIFKIWGFRDRMVEIAATPTCEEFARKSGDPRVPMPGWQKDVFQK
jgi:hypothetical protein